MGDRTKITLSEKELSLVTNAEWILTKQLITTKVYELFAEMIPVIKTAFLAGKDIIPPEPAASVPKISKGEHYLQLPYVMLDYPRCFDRENIFAIRTMFWWANFFSITLHVSGKYSNTVRSKLLKHKEILLDGFYVGVNENQWEHHFEPHNFFPYAELDENGREKLFDKNDFIKLALKFELAQWNNMPALLNEGYNKIAALIS